MAQTFERTRGDARLRARRVSTLGLAVAAGLAVWLVSDPLAGIDLTVGAGETARTVDAASIIVAAVIAGGAGWALLAFLERRLPRGRRVWRITAWSVLALSLLGPVLTGARGGALACLIVMHIAVGTTLVLGLAPQAEEDGAVS